MFAYLKAGKRSTLAIAVVTAFLVIPAIAYAATAGTTRADLKGAGYCLGYGGGAGTAVGKVQITTASAASEGFHPVKVDVKIRGGQLSPGSYEVWLVNLYRDDAGTVVGCAASPVSTGLTVKGRRRRLPRIRRSLLGSVRAPGLRRSGLGARDTPRRPRWSTSRSALGAHRQFSRGRKRPAAARRNEPRRDRGPRRPSQGPLNLRRARLYAPRTVAGLKGWLGLVAVAAAGLATGLWVVGGAGAKLDRLVSETTKTTNTFPTTTVTTTVSTTTETTPAPELASFVPASGSPGTSIVIRGRGFTGSTAVSVNGTGASFSVDSDISITARLPANATSGPITVQTPGGTLTSSASFVVTSVAPGQAVAYQIDRAHDGVQTDAALDPPFTRRWTASFANPTSYPVIAEGKVFVTVSTSPTYGGNLYALDQTDGHVLWSQAIPGTYYFSAAAYDAGKVFVVNFNGLLRAFDAASGAQLGKGSFRRSGRSRPRRSQRTAWSTRAEQAAVGRCTQSTSSTARCSRRGRSRTATTARPSLSDTGVFVSYACNQAYGFSQTSLAPLWHYSTFCEGGGGKTTVYANGDVFTRDFGNLILDAATGTLLSTFDSSRAPAVDATTIYGLSASTLSAQRLSGGQTRWTFTGDGQLTTAPIVIQTPAGEYVIVGSTSGMLYALDAASGAQVWSANVGAPLPGPDDRTRPPSQASRPDRACSWSRTATGSRRTRVEAHSRPTRRRRRSRLRPGSPPRRPGRPARRSPTSVTASDPDDAPAQITLTCVPASGSTFALGTTTVTCNAHDAAGNNATPATFPVTVRDTTPPVDRPDGEHHGQRDEPIGCDRDVSRRQRRRISSTGMCR